MPAYVIKEFGTPPAIPSGALSDTLLAAMEVAFVDSMETASWQEAQKVALREIVAAGDPRVAWLIANLMRFAPSQWLNAELANAAAALLEINAPTQNHWASSPTSSSPGMSRRRRIT